MTNVLVFTPTWQRADGSYAIHPDCEAAINTQKVTFNGRVEWCIGLENPYPVGDHRNVVAQYKKAREILLADDYCDALLTVEHDNVMVEPDTIQRMVDVAVGDVIYAPYVLRHGAGILSTWRYEGERNLGMSLTRYPEELARARENITWRVSGVGMGCTLFWRNALEQIDFRAGDGPNYAPDIPFAHDALARGFISMGRFDVPVNHWTGSGWLYPYEGNGVSEYLCRVSGHALTQDGTRFILVAGKYIRMTPEQAAELCSIGYIELPVDETRSATAEPEGEQAVVPTAKRGKKAK